MGWGREPMTRKRGAVNSCQSRFCVAVCSSMEGVMLCGGGRGETMVSPRPWRAASRKSRESVILWRGLRLSCVKKGFRVSQSDGTRPSDRNRGRPAARFSSLSRPHGTPHRPYSNHIDERHTAPHTHTHKHKHKHKHKHPSRDSTATCEITH